MPPLSLTYHPDTGIHFSSSHIYDFGYFLHRLHSPHLPSIAEHVRYLSFNLPYDAMIWSGVMNFLDSAYFHSNSPSICTPPYPHPTSSSNDIVQFANKTVPSPDPPASLRYPGDLGVAGDMCRSLLEAYTSPADAPTRKWFQVLVRLVKCCENLETIDMPWEWHDVSLYPGNFARIEESEDGCEKRQLGDGRWRFGRDPAAFPVEEVEEGGEEMEVE
jgi:hypothetical protein